MPSSVESEQVLPPTRPSYEGTSGTQVAGGASPPSRPPTRPGLGCGAGSSASRRRLRSSPPRVPRVQSGGRAAWAGAAMARAGASAARPCYVGTPCTQVAGGASPPSRSFAVGLRERAAQARRLRVAGSAPAFLACAAPSALPGALPVLACDAGQARRLRLAGSAPALLACPASSPGVAVLRRAPGWLGWGRASDG